jgi:hypothetical protein
MISHNHAPSKPPELDNVPASDVVKMKIHLPRDKVSSSQHAMAELYHAMLLAIKSNLISGAMF